MRIRVATMWTRLRNSFWFMPLMLTLLAVALAIGARALDRTLQPCEFPELEWLCYPGDLDGARTLASMIAGSMISIASTVFSITIAVLAFTSSKKSLPTAISRQVNGTFILGTGRMPGQDIEYALHQLVEIALRALSSGINDPFTAMTCIDWLGASLNQVAGRDVPSPYRHDREGYLRLVLDPLTFDGLANAAFDQIRQAGRPSVSVTLRLLEAMGIVMSHAERESHRQIIREQAMATYRGIMATDIDESDRRDVEKRFQKVLRAARKPGRSQK